MLSAGATRSPQPVPAITAAFSPAPAFTQGTSQSASPALPGRSTRGKPSGTSAAGSPAPIGQTQGDPTAGSKRKADQLQVDEPLQVSLLVLINVLRWPKSHEDGTCLQSYS